MAAPTWQSVATTSTTGATSLAVPMPSGATVGDLLIAQVSARTTGALTNPTGWTEIRSGVSSAHGAVWAWRECDGTEGASQTWTWAASCKAIGCISRISGADTTTPVNVLGAIVNQNSSTPAATTGVTTTVDDCLLIFTGYTADDMTFTQPGTMTERWDQTTTNNSDVSHWGATQTLGAAGATGTRTVVPSKSMDGRAFLMAIAPTPPAEFRQAIGLTIFGG